MQVLSTVPRPKQVFAIVVINTADIIHSSRIVRVG